MATMAACSASAAVVSNARLVQRDSVASSSSSRAAVSFAARPWKTFGVSKAQGGVVMLAKKEINESLLTPRFYTTDFEEMEQLFNKDINKNLNQEEFDSLLQEFKTDYNQTHFVRNAEFKAAAEKLQGPLRQIFVEFLERSCTAEFSGFLLYKELGRRLKVLALLVHSRLHLCRLSCTVRFGGECAFILSLLECRLWCLIVTVMALYRKRIPWWRRSSR